MKTDILIYLDSPLSDTELIFADFYIPQHLREILAPAARVFYCVPESYTGRMREDKECLVRAAADDDVSSWKKIFAHTGSDQIIKVRADAPFFDASICSEIKELHEKYAAEYTYSENLPPGFACEVISRSLIESVPDSGEKFLPLHDVVKSNINQFDVELFYKDPDLRDTRLSFTVSKAREKKIMQNLYAAAGGVPQYAEIRGLLNNNPQTLYVGPSYLEIELTGECSLDCIFCYRKTLEAARPPMKMETFNKLIADMREFDLLYAVCLGGSGEPMAHPNFYQILKTLCAEKNISDIIIETNGVLADSGFADFLRAASDPRIQIIVNVNGYTAETYTSLHGADAFGVVEKNIMALAEFFPKENLFVQIMKINETEAFLDEYYDFWEAKKITIILQKQNTYNGRIADRRYSDLSPLERSHCCHLEHDMYILSDGTVSFCKEDVAGAHSLGNITSEGAVSVWQKTAARFTEDYRHVYSASAGCDVCDEWYTF